MKKFKPIDLDKQKDVVIKSQIKFTETPKDHFWKSMILVGVVNIFLGLINFEKYFLNNELTYDNALSHFRKNDHMSVALAARPYDQISDYLTSKNNIDNGYQIIKDGKIVPPKKNFPTSLGYRKTIKLGYTDMSEDKGNYFFNYVKDMLTKNYEFVFEQDNPDYLLFSFYGCNHNNPKYKDAIKIAIYEEGYIPSFIEEDYTFGLAHIFYLDRYFRKSTLIEFLQKMNLKNKDFREARQKALNSPMRTKFCGALINNETNQNHFRERFMEELSKYKTVSMAFEKNTADGFSTDHILYALLAGTVPIYYGDYLVDEYINPNTYILVRNDVDLQEKIEYIKKVDQDDNLYRKFLMEDVLVDEDVVRKRKKDEKDYWSHIFRPDKYDAKRIDHVRFKTRKCMIKK